MPTSSCSAPAEAAPSDQAVAGPTESAAASADEPPERIFALPEPPRTWGRAEPYLKAAILVVVFALLASIIRSGVLWAPVERFARTPLQTVFWVTAITYGGVMYAAFVWRVWLWRRYRPMPPAPDERLPSLSVIIPAFNEGPLVRYAIRSAAGSRYPAERLEIIAIDDGSADDTWTHILASAREAGDRVRVRTLRQLRNQGKRQALYQGFRAARGEVFVTVDSDSILEPDALRNAVAPLVHEPDVGCVAGCVKVLNPRESIITRFLKCTFSLSFKFARAFQSQFRGVFCTPGALSVYRADVVRRVADEWVHQRFLGRACATGEDRAMTNLFLREGWMTAYQGSAVVWSRMPATYSGMTRMFLRWARSNIRETIVLFRFLFKPFRRRFVGVFRLNMILTALTLVLPPLLVINSAALMLSSQDYLLRHFGLVVIYGLTVALVYYANERDSDWIWLLFYEFFWVLCLSWIMPYAAMTLRNTGWLTRPTHADRQAEGAVDVDGELLRLGRAAVAQAVP